MVRINRTAKTDCSVHTQAVKEPSSHNFPNNENDESRRLALLARLARFLFFILNSNPSARTTTTTTTTTTTPPAESTSLGRHTRARRSIYRSSQVDPNISSVRSAQRRPSRHTVTEQKPKKKDAESSRVHVVRRVGGVRVAPIVESRRQRFETIDVLRHVLAAIGCARENAPGRDPGVWNHRRRDSTE